MTIGEALDTIRNAVNDGGYLDTPKGRMKAWKALGAIERWENDNLHKLWRGVGVDKHERCAFCGKSPGQGHEDHCSVGLYNRMVREP